MAHCKREVYSPFSVPNPFNLRSIGTVECSNCGGYATMFFKFSEKELLGDGVGVMGLRGLSCTICRQTITNLKRTNQGAVDEWNKVQEILKSKLKEREQHGE